MREPLRRPNMPRNMRPPLTSVGSCVCVFGSNQKAAARGSEMRLFEVCVCVPHITKSTIATAELSATRGWGLREQLVVASRMRLTVFFSLVGVSKKTTSAAQLHSNKYVFNLIPF